MHKRAQHLRERQGQLARRVDLPEEDVRESVADFVPAVERLESRCVSIVSSRGISRETLFATLTCTTVCASPIQGISTGVPD